MRTGYALWNAAAALMAAVVLLAPGRVSAHRQEVAAPAAAPTLDMRSLLERVPYDAGEHGPLVVVAPPRAFVPARPVVPAGVALSLGTIADIAGYKVIPAGRGLTAVVPATMTVIVSAPGKANPYAGMSRSDLTRLLMATLTSAQWVAIGGPGGLGPGDLDADQKLIFERMLPELELVHATMVKSEYPVEKEEVESRTPIDPATLRLRLTRLAQFYFPVAGGAVGNDANEHPRQGDTFYRWAYRTTPPPDDPANVLSPTVYGAAILKVVPNRLKPSDIDFRAPALDVRVSLAAPAGAALTVGELVARIGRAAGIDLVADRRVGGLDVFVRGTEARAGDVLEALCLGVTGAIRRVGSTATFVLAADREGTGASYGRLSEWADEAEAARAALIERADKNITQANGLANIHFAPGDPLAPSDEQEARLEAHWRSPKWPQPGPGPFIRMTEIPEAMRAAAQRSVDGLQHLDPTTGQPRYTIRTDGFYLDNALRGQWVVPGIGPVADTGIDINGLHRFVEKEHEAAVPAPAAANTPPPPPLLHRRVLLARLDSSEAAAPIVAAARAHGFGEVWFHVALSGGDPAATARLLTDAVRAGKKRNIAVGASLDLLRGDGAGEPERNILGETGDQFAARQKARASRTAAHTVPLPPYLPPNPLLPLAGYTGWKSPAADTARVAALIHRATASAPGLSCVVVRSSAPPGFARVPGGDDVRDRFLRDGLMTNGTLGYTDARRVAFLRAENVDPIDIPELGSLRRLLSVPFFPADAWVYNGNRWEPPPWDHGRKPALAAWTEFRWKENETRLAGVFDALHASGPDGAGPPRLLLDDRAAPCLIGSNDLRFWGSWFVSWDRRDGLPRNTFVYDAVEALNQARRSKARDILMRFALIEEGVPAPLSLSRFAAKEKEAEERASKEGWDGLVVDLSACDPAETLRRLTAFPPARR